MGDFGAIEEADRTEYGQYGGAILDMAAYGGSSSMFYLDEEDDDWGAMDMFSSVKVDSMLEKELNAAIKADKKHAGTAKLLKAAVNVDCDPSQDNDDEKLYVADLEAQLEEMLDRADGDVASNSRWTSRR